jgi:hypothetical protein
MGSGRQQEQVMSDFCDLLGGPEELRGWGEPVRFVEDSQRPRDARPGHFAQDIGIVSEQVY